MSVETRSRHTYSAGRRARPVCAITGTRLHAQHLTPPNQDLQGRAPCASHSGAANGNPRASEPRDPMRGSQAWKPTVNRSVAFRSRQLKSAEHGKRANPGLDRDLIPPVLSHFRSTELIIPSDLGFLAVTVGFEPIFVEVTRAAFGLQPANFRGTEFSASAFVYRDCRFILSHALSRGHPHLHWPRVSVSSGWIGGGSSRHRESWHARHRPRRERHECHAVSVRGTC